MYKRQQSFPGKIAEQAKDNQDSGAEKSEILHRLVVNCIAENATNDKSPRERPAANYALRLKKREGNPESDVGWFLNSTESGMMTLATYQSF